MQIGLKLKHLMEQRKWSQSELGRELGISQQRISKWIQGVGGPRGPELLTMARSLRVPLEYLCDDSLDDPPPAGGKALASASTDRIISADGLSEDEQFLLKLSRVIGIKEAVRRLTYVRAEPQVRRPVTNQTDRRNTSTEK